MLYMLGTLFLESFALINASISKKKKNPFYRRAAGVWWFAGGINRNQCSSEKLSLSKLPQLSSTQELVRNEEWTTVTWSDERDEMPECPHHFPSPERQSGYHFKLYLFYIHCYAILKQHWDIFPGSMNIFGIKGRGKSFKGTLSLLVYLQKVHLVQVLTCNLHAPKNKGPQMASHNTSLSGDGDQTHKNWKTRQHSYAKQLGVTHSWVKLIEKGV